LRRKKCPNKISSWVKFVIEVKLYTLEITQEVLCGSAKIRLALIMNNNRELCSQRSKV
jgi:hypothetical protein